MTNLKDRHKYFIFVFIICANVKKKKTKPTEKKNVDCGSMFYAGPRRNVSSRSY